MMLWLAAMLSASCAGAQSGAVQAAKPPMAAALAPQPAPSANAAEIVIFGFEGGLEGWAIPDWAKASADNVALSCQVSDAKADQGMTAMEIQTDFPGGRWTGAYVERETDVTDWTAFGTLSVDVFLPAAAPEGLGGKIILTVSDQWTWTEMNRAIRLEPGKWTTVTANLKPGSLDWKFFPTDEFRKDIRKVGFRIESDKKPSYSGPIYIDNIQLTP